MSNSETKCENWAAFGKVTGIVVLCRLFVRPSTWPVCWLSCSLDGDMHASPFQMHSKKGSTVGYALSPHPNAISKGHIVSYDTLYDAKWPTTIFVPSYTVRHTFSVFLIQSAMLKVDAHLLTAGQNCLGINAIDH